MSYVAPTTKTTGTLITAAIWNQDVVANIVAIKDPPTDNQRADEASDYTSSSTTFVDVDSAGDPDFSLSITTTGGDIMVGFVGTMTNGTAAARAYIDIALDGVRQGLDDGLFEHQAAGGTLFPCGFVYLIRGVSAGTHTIKLQYKVSSGTATIYAGAGSANADLHPQFWCREAS